MVLEVVKLTVIEGQQENFERDYKIAAQYISASKGYIKHSIHKSLEVSNEYIQFVEWENLEDHTVTFFESELFQEWAKLLHHYYDPMPTVEHYETSNILG
jgi:heme-degrading monooxygenase HmoA